MTRISAIILLLLGAGLLIPLPGLAQGQPELAFGLLPVVDALPLIVAAEENFFAQEGLNLKLVNFTSALERDVALQAGRINGYFGDLLNTLMLCGGGEKLKIITTAWRTDPERRMFALLAAPGSGLTRLDQIQGQTVAISTASIIEFILDELIDRHGLSQVKKTEVRQIPIRYQLLLGGGLKLAVLPEPLATKAEQEGAVALADDRSLDLALTILALRADLLDRDPRLASKFLQAYRRGLGAIQAAPARAKELLVRRTQFPPGLQAAYGLPRFPEPRLPSPQDVGRAQSWLLGKGIISRPLPYSAVVVEGAGD